MRYRSSFSRAFVRSTAALMAVLVVFTLRPARSAPGDIFTMPAPMIGTDPPKASDIKDGDASVATQTGALQYSYPIDVPPGRQGMAPKLALSYSSQAPTYGGIAAGWSLSVPDIREDHSQGRLRTRSPLVDSALTPEAAKADDRFVSSLAGGRPLVPVTEPGTIASDVFMTYRAQNDTSYARYERMKDGVGGAPFRWRVRTTDGIVMTFGEASRMPGCTRVSDRYAPLTGMIDPFGNEVKYLWEDGIDDDECRLDRIVWGQNANAAVPEFAQVVFNWGEGRVCNGVFSNTQVDFRTGERMVTGTSKLVSITATAFAPGAPQSAVHTRLISLGYADNEEGGGPSGCNLPHAPVRLLTSIQESAWGTDAPRVDLPPVTFQYNSPAVTFTSEATTGSWFPTAPTGNALSWGYRRNDDRSPSVEAMNIDLDGDGLVDRLYNNSYIDANNTVEECRATWRRNLGVVGGTPTFAAPENLPLPRLKWQGPNMGYDFAGSQVSAPGHPWLETCSLSGQFTTYQNSDDIGPICHGPPNPPWGGACQPATDPDDDQTYCAPGGTECPNGSNAQGPYRTFLAYRWLDMDADGLVDLVTAIHGDIDRYDPEMGSHPSFWAGEPSMSGIPGVGQWPACPTDVDRCKDDVNTCFDDEISCDGPVCTVDWTGISACIDALPTAGCSKIMAKTSPAIDGAPASSPVKRTPYTRCEGLYPWFIYKNQGKGVLASTPIVKYQPVPLDSDSGDSSFGGAGVSSQNHAIMDFDGDGILDAIVREREQDVNDEDGDGNTTEEFMPRWWQVWLGDGTGGFLPRRHFFPVRLPGTQAPGDNSISATGGVWGQGGWSSVGLLDVNGDALPDHWRAVPSGQVDTAFQDGVGLRLPGETGEIATPLISPTYAVKPGSDAYMVATPPVGFGQPIEVGYSKARNRAVDIDHDGRVDVVHWPTTSSTGDVYFNLGGQFRATASPLDPLTPPLMVGAQRLALADATSPGTPSTWDWKLTTDLIDLDGDGIQESVHASGSGLVRSLRSSSQPPRLLSAIHNGRGAHSTITYAHMHETDVVVQDAKSEWFDGRPMASPRTQWVVRSIQSSDDFSAAIATTSYRYAFPRFGADDEGHYSFRGFAEVTTTSPSGSRTVQRYGYDVDWSGRLVATLVKPALTEGTEHEVRSMDTTTYQPFTLFGGAVTTYHPVRTEHFTCANGQTDPLGGQGNPCTSTSAPGYTRTVTTWTAYPGSPAGQERIWVEELSTLQAGETVADGDRRTNTTYELHADATRYLLRTLETKRTELAQGQWLLYGKQRSTWDPSYGTQLTDEVWKEDNDSTRLITRFEYDNTTGNVLLRWKPKQNAASGPALENIYDSRKLFVASEINEVGHQLDFAHEYGTGTRIQTDGPNNRSCTTGQPNCPLDATHPLRQQTKLVVDGLGRPLQRWETVSDDGSVYVLHHVETNIYIDTPVGSTPTSVTNKLRIDVAGSVWKETRTQSDGHGRPKQVQLLAQGTAPADQFTLYTYSNDGTLKTVSVPDPAQNSSALVVYNYTFDSLGRATSIRRPDHVSPGSQSGVDMSYDGLTTTTTEFLGSAGGTAASTRTVNDRYGRLIEVHEKTGATSWATTYYEHTPANEVWTVTDPEGVMTTLNHDFAGRRKTIERAGKIWQYGYDDNGNLQTEISPSPNPPLTDPDYTTSIVYDDLDRPVSKSIAPRALSVADRELFASGTEVFTWDYGPNRKGQLRFWFAYAPGAGTPSISNDYNYDAQGRLWTTNHSMTIAGYPALQRQFLQQYYIFGGVRLVRNRDYVGGTNETIVEYTHDARGLLFRTRMTSPQVLVIGQQTRNVAGLVTKRYTTLGSNGFAESNWQYDKLGRVTSQVVRKKDPSAWSSPQTAASQTLSYFGNDDVSSNIQYLGTGTSKVFNFQYDPRHQLKSAVATVAGYFAGNYEYGDAGRLTRVTHARTITPTPPGSDLKPRDVNYVYGGADPEQVTALTNVSGGSTYASYTYDEAGNQVTRSYPATNELWEYVYDGRNQLRRATRKVNGVSQGSEEYWYDGSNVRMAIVKRDGSGAKTGMIRFIGDVEAHYNATGTVTKTYSHISMGTPAARLTRTGNTTTSLELQFHGLANNTLATVAQNGTVTSRFSYAPFGEVLESLDNGTHNRRFNDKFEDAISGLGYYGFRYYDKTLLTWTQSDPLYRFEPDAAWTQPRKALLYTAHLNNPLRYMDPDGRAVLVLPLVGPKAVAVAAAVATVAAAYLGDKIGEGLAAAARSNAYSSADDAQDIGRAHAQDRIEAAEFELNESNINQWANDGLDSAPVEHDSWRSQNVRGTQRDGEIAPRPRPIEAGHRKNKRESNRGKHERGDARRKRDKGGEKADKNRRDHRRRPPRWKGPWPPTPQGGSAAPQTESSAPESEADGASVDNGKIW